MTPQRSCDVSIKVVNAKNLKHGIKLCQEETPTAQANALSQDANASFSGADALRRVRPVKMPIAVVLLSGDRLENLAAIASAGFSGVEIFGSDLLSFSGAAADVRRVAADLGRKIVAFRPFGDFEGVPADKRERFFWACGTQVRRDAAVGLRSFGRVLECGSR